MSKKESQEFNSLGNGKNSIYENRIGLSHNDIEFDLFNPSNENLYKKENLSDAKMKKIQKNASLASKTASVLIATFTAASIGVSGVTSILPPQEKASIEIFAEEDYVSYFVEIEGYKDGQVYTVTIHNDFTNRKQEFVDGAIEGFEEGLRQMLLPNLLKVQSSHPNSDTHRNQKEPTLKSSSYRRYNSTGLRSIAILSDFLRSCCFHP